MKAAAIQQFQLFVVFLCSSFRDHKRSGNQSLNDVTKGKLSHLTQMLMTTSPLCLRTVTNVGGKGQTMCQLQQKAKIGWLEASNRGLSTVFPRG